LERKIKLLHVLADHKMWSGEALASKLGVTRATVSQWIKQLQQSGMEFNIVKGRGYRLVSPVQLLDKQLLLDSLSPKVRSLLSLVDISVQSPSTNDSAMKAQYPPGKWLLFSTEHQTQGRGRRGRTWESPPCSNLAFSLGYKGHIPMSQLYMSSLIAGYAVASELADCCQVDVKIKWPNDVYINDKKVAGILCELQGSPPDDVLLVIGTGINVFSEPNLTTQGAADVTSLARESRSGFTRTELLARLTDRMISFFYEFEKNGVDWFIKQWSALDLLNGRPIRVLKGDQVFQGVGAGIDESGQLRLKDQSGAVVLFNGGEVSVRWN